MSFVYCMCLSDFDEVFDFIVLYLFYGFVWELLLVREMLLLRNEFNLRVVLKCVVVEINNGMELIYLFYEI